MTYEEKVDLLSQYTELSQKVFYLEEKLYNTKPIVLDDIHGHTDKNINDDIMLKEELSKECDFIKDLIYKLKNFDEMILLDYIYIRNETMLSIYQKRLMHYSYSSLRRIHKRAINNIILDVDDMRK